MIVLWLCLAGTAFRGFGSKGPGRNVRTNLPFSSNSHEFAFHDKDIDVYSTFSASEEQSVSQNVACVRAGDTAEPQSAENNANSLSNNNKKRKKKKSVIYTTHNHAHKGDTDRIQIREGETAMQTNTNRSQGTNSKDGEQAD